MIPTKYWFIWPSGFRGEYFFRNQPIKTNNSLWQPCLLTDREVMSYYHGGPSIEASYQVAIHLAKRFQRRSCFRNQPNKKKNCLWRPCLLPDRHEMRNLYRRPSKKASCQISVHLRKQIQRRRLFRNQPIKNKNCLWRPCLLMNGDEMSNLHR